MGFKNLRTSFILWAYIKLHELSKKVTQDSRWRVNVMISLNFIVKYLIKCIIKWTHPTISFLKYITQNFIYCIYTYIMYTYIIIIVITILYFLYIVINTNISDYLHDTYVVFINIINSVIIYIFFLIIWAYFKLKRNIFYPYNIFLQARWYFISVIFLFLPLQEIAYLRSNHSK